MTVNDDLATVKALRKAKKKEIQAWITTFEEREGRSPEASDKEAVRPMYREFKELETKLAELTTLAEETDRTEPPVGTSGEPGAVQLKGGDAGAGGEEDLAAVKSERDAKKREIKLWIKEFEEREGRPPTTEDKAPIKALYREFKDLEHRLAQSPANESAAASDVVDVPVTSPGEDAAVDVEEVKAEKKRVKLEIQTWLDEFEAREGRAAEQADKAEIRPLYKRHKNLERELERFAGQVSPEPSNAAAAATSAAASSPSAAAASSPPEEPSDEHDADNRAVLSPTSSIGAGENVTSQEGNPESPAVQIKDANSESRLEESNSEEKGTKKDGAENEDAMAAPAISISSDLKDQVPASTPPYAGRDRELEGSGDGEEGEAKEEKIDDGGTSETPEVTVSGEDKIVADVPGDEAATDNPHQEEPLEQERPDEIPDDSAVVTSPTPLPSPAGGDGGEGKAKEEKIDDGGTSETPEVKVSGEDESGADIPGDEAATDHPQQEEPLEQERPDEILDDSTAVTSPTPVLSPADDSAKHRAGEEEVDSEVVMGSSTRDEGDVPGRDDDGNKRNLEPCVEGETYEAWPGRARGDAPGSLASAQGGEQDDGDNKPMTAQEARVKRMRMRFLRMKNLIDDDAVGASSLVAASSTLSDGADALFETEEKEDGITSPPEERARSRWATLGRVLAPNGLVRSPRSQFQEIAARLTAGGTGRTDGGPSEAGTTSPSPCADDGVSDAWATDQLSNILLLDSSLPAKPPPPRVELLEAEASRLRTAVDPPPPGYMAEYQEGVRGAEVVVASVGVEEVEARERSLELERLAAAREEVNVYRAREANLLYREDRARQRVLALKDSIQNSVLVEKQAVIEISIARERALAPAFARARRGLENAIRAQAGRVREVFGELRPGEVPGGRRFRVDWRGVPQPVEIRLHCIRAVRDRLPRGSYVMLSSMAERLGGRVMRWTKGHEFDDLDDEDSIDTEGGDTRPAATLPVQHGGRYFDRELRIDQNVYQLCPSKSEVRPGNVMVFELFRLASSGGGGGGSGTRNDSSRHKGGELDEDTAVGWCVLPLADSRLRVIRGSFRIPLLRGEPNPNIDLHEGLEKLIAADLEAWLGNLYLDVRHLPREARLDGPGPEGGSAMGGEGFDIEYDHVRKVVRLGKGLCANLTTPKGRWRRGWGRKADDSSTIDEDGAMVARADDASLEDEADFEEGGWASGLMGAMGVEDEKKKTVVAENGGGDTAKQAAGKSAESGEVAADGSTTKKKKGWGAIALKNVKKPTENPLTLAEEGESVAVGSTTKKVGWGSIAKNIKKPIENPAKPAEDGESAVGGSTPKKVGWGSIAKSVGKPIENAKSAEGGGGAASGAAAKKSGWGSIAKSVGKPADGPKNPSDWVQLVGKAKKTGDAPPPDGGWVSANKRQDGGDSDDGIDVDKTIDEECLSDDDLLRGSKFRFTPVGEAAKAVDTAAGAALSEGRNARGMGLRRRGEGARWDSSGLGTGFKGLPRRYGGGNASGRDTHVWTRLTNVAEMEYYRFAVASDPGTDAPSTPANIIRHKLRYIRQEVLLDLHPRGWKKMEYWLAVMVSIGALWLRIYLHALGQWLMLYSLGVPVFSFTPKLWEFAIKYMDRSSSLGVEVAFVWWGPTFVTLCFAMVAALARLWGMAACGGKGGGGGEGVPEAFSRFVAAFGVGAALDPYLLFVVDLVATNYGCSEQCSDYTSPSCRCHEGDAWKLYVRLDDEEGAGITGALLTIMIYTMVSITTALILHQYLLHAHMNGRMLDVWRRLNAREDDFFVPHDLEVSAAELQHACMRARRFSGAGGARREVIVHDFHATEETPPEGASSGSSASGGDNKATTLRNKLWGGRGGKTLKGSPGRVDAYATRVSTMHVAIYDVSAEAKKTLHRQFLRTPNGSILEMFGETDREVGWQLRSSLNALMREEAGGGSKLEEDKQEKGIFAGMLPASAPAAVATPAAPVVATPSEDIVAKGDGDFGSTSTEVVDS